MENLERTGYRFDGWFVDEARTKRINPGGKLPGSVTLYDKWIPITYSVTYDLGGGQNSEKNPQFITIESGLKKLYPSIRTEWSLRAGAGTENLSSIFRKVFMRIFIWKPYMAKDL
ncbi:InlB B-repeat-containing protein [Ileibacterium valens]|uniref:InlB B-repeat-containing protein n=1 Tax=Ileibacterium valens TaxID=1862668 RepID=UPI00272B251D|nr:InlB B-repeat-containing protein [Ileibacterium valens]